jgi:hypothetical protein
VQVVADVRIVVVHQLDERLRLRRVELHVVAVDVQVLRVGARAHPVDRAVLALPVVQRELFVAVGVVDRRDEEDHRVEPRRVPPERQLAQQDLRRLLALDLAGVHVGLDVHAQFP